MYRTREEIYSDSQLINPFKSESHLLPEKWQLDAMQVYANQEGCLAFDAGYAAGVKYVTTPAQEQTPCKNCNGTKIVPDPMAGEGCVTDCLWCQVQEQEAEGSLCPTCHKPYIAGEFSICSSSFHLAAAHPSPVRRTGMSLQECKWFVNRSHGGKGLSVNMIDEVAQLYASQKQTGEWVVYPNSIKPDKDRLTIMVWDSLTYRWEQYWHDSGLSIPPHLTGWFYLPTPPNQ